MYVCPSLPHANPGALWSKTNAIKKMLTSVRRIVSFVGISKPRTPSLENLSERQRRCAVDKLKDHLCTCRTYMLATWIRKSHERQKWDSANGADGCGGWSRIAARFSTCVSAPPQISRFRNIRDCQCCAVEDTSPSRMSFRKERAASREVRTTFCVGVICVTARDSFFGQYFAFATRGACNVAEDSGGWRDRIVPGLNGGGAPGLEQSYHHGSCCRDCLHGIVRGRRGMGAEDPRHMALKAAVRTKKKSVPVSQNAFAGQSEPPTQNAVESALGESYSLWRQLVQELKQELGLDGEDWHSSGVKYGWALRLQQKKRNIVYLGPRARCFMAAFILGDKAIAAVRKSALPADLLRAIAKTKRYGEGTPVRIEVSKSEDLKAVKIIAKIKVEN